MKTPPCPCCGVEMKVDNIIPDGVYIYGETSLVSFKCVPPCKTNRAIKFEMVTPELRKAAMLADLAADSESEVTL